MGWLGFPDATIDDCHNAKGRDEHGDKLSRFPFKLEDPYYEDVGEEGVRVPDCGDIAEPVVREKSVDPFRCQDKVDAYGDSDTLMNHSSAGKVRPTVRNAVKRKRRP